MSKDVRTEFSNRVSTIISGQEALRRREAEERIRINQVEIALQNELQKLFTVAQMLGPIAASTLAPSTVLTMTGKRKPITRRYPQEVVDRGWIVYREQEVFDSDSRNIPEYTGALLTPHGYLGIFTGQGLLGFENPTEGNIHVSSYARWSGPPAHLRYENNFHRYRNFTPNSVIDGLARFAASNRLVV